MISSTCHVDWFSFTIPLHSAGIDLSSKGSIDHVMALLSHRDFLAVHDLARNDRWEIVKGRVGYTAGIAEAQTGMRIFGAEKQRHLLIECSGKTCSVLRDLGLLDQLINSQCDRASRIDLATDLETDDRPIDFILNGDMALARSKSHIVSDTGETVYIGSRKSERMLRVYRYDYPHERAHLLRLEIEFKGDKAKAVSRMVSEDGLLTTLASVHAQYQWRVDFLQSTTEGKPRSLSTRTPKAEASWMKWLSTAVKPSLLSAARLEGFDLRSWCAEILSELD